MNLDVAAALRESRGEWLLPDVLAQQVGLDAAGLRAALRDLRTRGFRIEVRPGGAMRVTAAPDALEAGQIAHRLGTRLIGARVTVEAETASTNDLAWAALEAGGPEGECFLAEHQTGGRGRRGRRWFAPPGQALLLSVGLRPTPVRDSLSTIDGERSPRSQMRTPPPAHLRMRTAQVYGSALTFAASVAAVEGIAGSTGLSCAIEWPNDITLGDRKVAGILVEGRLAFLAPSGRNRLRHAQDRNGLKGLGLFGAEDMVPSGRRRWHRASGVGHVASGIGEEPGVAPEDARRPTPGPVGAEKPDWAFVVGVGINANVPVGALPPGIRETATSLAEACGRAVDRIVLARHFIRALDRWYGALRTGGLAAVRARWLDLSATVGRRLCLLEDGRRFEGEVVSVSPTEGLALRLNHGEVRFFQSDSATVVSRSGRA